MTATTYGHEGTLQRGQEPRGTDTADGASGGLVRSRETSSSSSRQRGHGEQGGDDDSTETSDADSSRAQSGKRRRKTHSTGAAGSREEGSVRALAPQPGAPAGARILARPAEENGGGATSSGQPGGTESHGSDVHPRAKKRRLGPRGKSSSKSWVKQDKKK
jgi:hypothetical protein